MNKKYYITVAVLALMITTVGVTALASAGELNNWRNKGHMSGDMKAEFKAHHGELKTIMENEDYDAWKILMDEKADKMQERFDTFKSTINEDTFNSMLRLHELKTSGDMEGAKALAEELGLMKNMHKKGKFMKCDNKPAMLEQ